MNNSLLQIKSDVKPVFGKSARWFCWGKKEIMPVKSCDRTFEATSQADVCFLYLLTPGERVRIQCPALDFDRHGEFEEVWAAFYQATLDEAAELTGLAPDEIEGCVTISWMGETRASILNVNVEDRPQPEPTKSETKNPALEPAERGTQKKEIFLNEKSVSQNIRTRQAGLSLFMGLEEHDDQCDALPAHLAGAGRERAGGVPGGISHGAELLSAGKPAQSPDACQDGARPEGAAIMRKVYPPSLPACFAEFPELLKGKAANAAEMVLAAGPDQAGALACEMAARLLEEEIATEKTIYSHEERKAVWHCGCDIEHWGCAFAGLEKYPDFEAKVIFSMRLAEAIAWENPFLLHKAFFAVRRLALFYRKIVTEWAAKEAENVA